MTPVKIRQTTIRSGSIKSDLDITVHDNAVNEAIKQLEQKKFNVITIHPMVMIGSIACTNIVYNVCSDKS